MNRKKSGKKVNQTQKTQKTQKGKKREPHTKENHAKKGKHTNKETKKAFEMELSYKLKLYHGDTMVYAEHFIEHDFRYNLECTRRMEATPQARVDTGHLELWYGIVHIRTLVGYNDGFKVRWNKDSLLFRSDSKSEHAFNVKPRFLSYYSFRLQTSLEHSNGKTMLMMGMYPEFTFFSGDVGDLSYGRVDNTSRTTRIDATDLIAMFKIESGLCLPQDALPQCESLVHYSYGPDFCQVFFKCVIKLKRLSRRAQHTFQTTIRAVLRRHTIDETPDIVECILHHRFD